MIAEQGNDSAPETAPKAFPDTPKPTVPNKAAAQNFELPYLLDYTPEAILDELRRVAALVEHPVLSAARFNRHGRVDCSTVIDHFGSWKSALQRADLAHRFSGCVAPHRKTPQTDADLLDAIRATAKKKRSAVLSTSDLEAEGISDAVLRVRFGSIAKAVKKAGFRHISATARRTAAECHDNLLTVWRHYGRAPSISEMNLPPSVIGLGPYARQHRTWKRAVAAFVKRMKEDPEGQALIEQDGEAAKTRRYAKRPPQRDRHKISLSLRFEVLQRDRFRCTVCGANPAAEPRCRLHVDHIRPWSRGGKTEPGNLRTLCAECNLGRDARMEAEEGRHG